MLGKVTLWVAALAFIPYGLACLYDPVLPAKFAGFAISSADGSAEIAAMYGGLQTGFGFYCLWGALRADLYRPALASLVLLIGALATARLFWALGSLASISGYTYGALAFEFTIALLAFVALQKSSAQHGLTSV